MLGRLRDVERKPSPVGGLNIVIIALLMEEPSRSQADSISGQAHPTGQRPHFSGVAHTSHYSIR